MKPFTSSLWTRELGATCGLKEDVQGRHPSCYQRKAGVGMVAANGTPIEYHGQRQVRFRGVRKNSSFHRPR